MGPERVLGPFVGGLMFALEHAAVRDDRVQFGKPIKSFQAISTSWRIKSHYGSVEDGGLRVAFDKDSGMPLDHMHTSIAKAFMGDWGMKAASKRFRYSAVTATYTITRSKRC